MVNSRIINKRLREHLKMLQYIFDFGYDFKVIFIPKIKLLDNNKLLAGEFISNCIIIYRSNINPIYVLNHEFIELIHNNYTKDIEKIFIHHNHLSIQNNKTQLRLNRLLYLQREKFINQIVAGLMKYEKEKLYE